MKTNRILMLIFASAAILFSSCEKDDHGGSTSQQATTYTVQVSGIQIPSGINMELLAVEYSASNERLQVNRFNYTSSTMVMNYTANSHTEKVKIAMNVSNTNTGQTVSWWVQQVFYLNKGKNTVINVSGSSPTGDYEP